MKNVFALQIRCVASGQARTLCWVQELPAPAPFFPTMQVVLHPDGDESRIGTAKYSVVDDLFTIILQEIQVTDDRSLLALLTKLQRVGWQVLDVEDD